MLDHKNNSRKFQTQGGRWSGQQQNKQFYGKCSTHKPHCNIFQQVSTGKLEICSPWIKNIFSGKLLASESLQNTIFKVSSATEKATGDTLFNKAVANGHQRNSGIVKIRCS